jgi:hypothetical protein
MAQTVRIDPDSHAALAEIARAKSIPLTEALAHAVEAYRRASFLEEYAADVAAFRVSDPQGFAEDEAEAALWDATNTDGLRDEPPYLAPAPRNASKRSASERKASKRTASSKRNASSK